MALSKPRFRRAKNTQAIDGFYVTLPLQNGYRLRMDVELWEPGGTYRHDVDVSIMAYRGRFSLSRALKKEGTPTGPGGLEVVYPARSILDAAEIEARKRWPDVPLRMRVDAANERLYRFYYKVLAPRGYHATDWLLELTHPDLPSGRDPEPHRNAASLP